MNIVIGYISPYMDVKYKIISRHTTARTVSEEFQPRSSNPYVVTAADLGMPSIDQNDRFTDVRTSLEEDSSVSGIAL